MNTKDAIKNTIYGVAIGDAVGCPVQFFRREDAKKLNVTDMVGGGRYNKPAGTWTDDTSMTLCLADSLADSLARGAKIDYMDIMRRFNLWLCDGEYTTEERAFDMGRTCMQAIFNFRKGVPPLQCGGSGIQDNGNGSLMRISPIVFYLQKEFGADLLDDKKKTDAAFEIIQNVSALTHAHGIAKLGCCIYCALLLLVMNGVQKEDLLKTAEQKIKAYLLRHKEFEEASRVWERIFSPGFAELSEGKIKSTGYVVDTLEAAVWCFYNTDNYRDCIIKCLSLGHDTDTIGAVAGGLASLYYGELPDDWVEKLRGKEMIDAIVSKLADL